MDIILLNRAIDSLAIDMNEIDKFDFYLSDNIDSFNFYSQDNNDNIDNEYYKIRKQLFSSDTEHIKILLILMMN